MDRNRQSVGRDVPEPVDIVKAKELNQRKQVELQRAIQQKIEAAVGEALSAQKQPFSAYLSAEDVQSI